MGAYAGFQYVELGLSAVFMFSKVQLYNKRTDELVLDLLFTTEYPRAESILERGEEAVYIETRWRTGDRQHSETADSSAVPVDEDGTSEVDDGEVRHVVAWDGWADGNFGSMLRTGVPVTFGLFFDFDRGTVRLGMDACMGNMDAFDGNMRIGPLVTIGHEPLVLELCGYYGDQNVREVCSDGAIKPKRHDAWLNTPDSVPHEFLASDLRADEGTCNEALCGSCRFHEATEYDPFGPLGESSGDEGQAD